LTEQNYTYSKNSNKLLEIVSCGGLWRLAASCGHWTDRLVNFFASQIQLNLIFKNLFMISQYYIEDW